MKKWPIFGRKWPISDRFLARGGSNGISNDVFSISVIKNCIYNKGKLISAKITAQNSEIRENFDVRLDITLRYHFETAFTWIIVNIMKYLFSCLMKVFDLGHIEWFCCCFVLVLGRPNSRLRKTRILLQERWLVESLFSYWNVSYFRSTSGSA